MLLKLHGIIAAVCLFASCAWAQTREAAQTRPATRAVEIRFEPNAAVQWTDLFERDKNGFTYFPKGEGQQIIFMSASEGSDLNDGATKPVRSLKRALALLRNGSPDRLLLKRGDVFAAENLNEPFGSGGRSVAEPMIIGAYGDPRQPRPVLAVRFSLGGPVQPHFLVLQDLDFYADRRDPTLASFAPGRSDSRQGDGLYMNSGGRFLWIEDCRFRYFGNNLMLQGDAALFHGLVLRRCVVCDSYGLDGHSQGIYLDRFEHVLIEENLFDHNGWNDAVPNAGRTIFNHNLYLQHGQPGEQRNIMVRNNIIARASSHGCQLRPGGVLENNLFLKNPLAAFVSYAPSVVRNNVVLGGDGIGPSQPRGQGLEFLNCPAVLVEGNIVAHKPDPANNLSALSCSPMLREAPVPASRVEVRRNIVYDWTGVALATTSAPAGLLVQDNDFQQGDQPLIWLAAWRDGYRFSGNRYGSSSAQPFQIEKTPLDFQGWRGATGDTSQCGAAAFVDPSRDIAGYAQSIGLKDATLEGFLAAARAQRHGHWDNRLTAQAVNDYIRGGFAPRPATRPN